MSTRLIRSRLDLGLSIRQAAKAIPVDRRTLEKAERGQSLHPASAKRIAEFYGYKPSEIWPIGDEDGAAA